MNFFAKTTLPSFNPDFISMHTNPALDISPSFHLKVFFPVEIQTLLQILNSLLQHDCHCVKEVYRAVHDFYLYFREGYISPGGLRSL